MSISGSRWPVRHAHAVLTATHNKSGGFSYDEFAVVLNELLCLDSPSESSGRCGSHVSRVADGVVHPPSTEHRVLHSADEPIITAMKRGTAIGQRHLRHGAITGSNEEGFEADLTLWIIEPERSDTDQTCAGISDKPRLDWRPALEKFQFGRADLGPVQKCHEPMLAAATGGEGRWPSRLGPEPSRCPFATITLVLKPQVVAAGVPLPEPDCNGPQSPNRPSGGRQIRVLVQALASILDQVADPGGFANGVALRPGKRDGSGYQAALPEIVGAFFGWGRVESVIE